MKLTIFFSITILASISKAYLLKFPSANENKSDANLTDLIDLMKNIYDSLKSQLDQIDTKEASILTYILNLTSNANGKIQIS